MKIQSLSIVVPSRGCINRCRFCVSRMNSEEYENKIEGASSFATSTTDEYSKRLAFARDNGCNTVMLTGQCEPQQNRQFLEAFAFKNALLHSPFRWIEMQTTGVGLDDEYLEFLRDEVEVNTISVSISSFSAINNSAIIQTPKKQLIMLGHLCRQIKAHGFNLRLSVNLTDEFDDYISKPAAFFTECKDLGADQVTLRTLYEDGSDSEQARWVRDHSINPATKDEFEQFIISNGRKLERLEFGRTKYSVMGMSTVIDDDCMSQECSDSYKYLILRPDCHLYSKWDDKGSLIF